MNILDLSKQSALVVTLVGAVLTALNIYPLNIVFLNLGAALYLFWSWRVQDWNLVAVNLGLLVIYVLGAALKFLGLL